MILTVQHLTRYSFDRPQRSVVQSHRVTPSRFDGQRVIEWQVSVSGGNRGGEFRDGAGDLVQGWTIPGPVEAIDVMVQGRVETIDLAGVLKGHREVVPPEAYLRATETTAVTEALSSLALSVRDQDSLDLAHGLSAIVSREITYVTGSTHAGTTAGEVLVAGEGVCQDQAHVLIAMARSRGLPARYVTGYLGPDEHGTIHEASHAWAELFVQGFGWIGFDPVNRCCPDARYIRIGSGLDAREAALIRGIARGNGHENMGVTVAVQMQAQ